MRKRNLLIAVCVVAGGLAIYLANPRSPSGPAKAAAHKPAPPAAARTGPAPGARRPSLAEATARADQAIERATAPRDADAKQGTPLTQQFDDLATLTTALQSARHALQVEAKSSPGYAEASKEVTRLHAALTKTRLTLLQEWAGVVRSTVKMTEDEVEKFALLVNDQARTIASAGKPDKDAPSGKLKALLGPDRYAAYENRRRSFFPDATAGALVLP